MRVVTCIGPGGWELYGKNFVESFKANWPTEVNLTVFHHDTTFVPVGGINIEYRNLLVVDSEVEAFRKFCSQSPKFKGETEQGYNFRFDAFKFCHKVYATTGLAFNLYEAGYKGWLLWLDADTVTKAPVDMEWINRLLQGDIVHLPRATLPYSETSFVAYNLASDETMKFLANFRDAYVDKEVFAYAEWHDGFVFSRLLRIAANNETKVFSLTPPTYGGIDAFDNSPLAEKMIHLKGNRKLGPKGPGPGLQPLKIVPQDSMPKEHILNNANESDKLFKRWLKPCFSHGRKALIVSAGRSWEKHKETIRKAQEDGAYVMCIKHSLPLLMKEGIVPDGCVVLDPRPVNAKSTHGILRTTLFDKVDPKTTFFVASMTDTSVTKYIQEKTDKVIGWFAWTQALAQAKPPEGQPIVTGGTCAAWRAVSLLEALGFRHIRLYGFDFTVDGKSIDKGLKDDKGRAKYMEIHVGEEGNMKTMWTTGELAAGIQDAPAIMQQTVSRGMDVSIVGEDGAAHLWNFIRTKNKVDTKGPKYVTFEEEYP